jgi:hypothetical protein
MVCFRRVVEINHLSLPKYICPENKADVFIEEDSLMHVISASSFSSLPMPKPH